MTKLKALLEEKPREFWIDVKNDMYSDCYLPHALEDDGYKSSLHVVEAAYAARLRDELERCVKALDMARNVIHQMYCGRYGCGSTVGFSTTVPLCLLCKEKSELARNEINKLLGGGENE